MTMNDPHEPDFPRPRPRPRGRRPRRRRRRLQAESPAAAAVMKFKSCRWRCDPEDGEFCTHRDVLPFAGKERLQGGFVVPGVRVLQAAPHAEEAGLGRGTQRLLSDAGRAVSARLQVPSPNAPRDRALLGEFARQLNPFPLRRELLVGLPVRLGFR